MKLKVIIKLAFKHLKNKKTRSIITIAGMALGVGVVVFLLSFGFGLQKVVTDQLVNLASIDTIEVTSRKSEAIKLDGAAISEFKNIAGVAEVVGLSSTAGKLSLGASSTDVVVYGASSRYLELSDVKPTAGKLLSEGTAAGEEAVVNTVVLKIIGLEGKEALGEEIELNFVSQTGDSEVSSLPVEKLKIVGVVGDEAGSFVYLHEDVLRKVGLNTFSQLKVLVKDRGDIPKIRTQIDSMGYTTIAPLDTLNEINQAFKILRIFLGVFGSIGLFIAAGGMFNTLIVSLLERTREVGLMKMLGARRIDILKMFLAEAVIMAFVGGLIGVLLAFTIGVGINIWISILAKQREADVVSLFYIPIAFALFIILFASLIGVVTAIYPARRAAKINPIEALRHE